MPRSGSVGDVVAGLVNLLLVLDFFGSWTFMVLYHFSARWWEELTGRGLMGMTGASAMVLLTRVLAIIFGTAQPPPSTYWGENALRAFGLFTWGAMLIVLTVSLLREQQRPGAGREVDDGRPADPE